MSDSGVQEVYVYAGMRLVPETRLLLWAEKLAAAESAVESERRWAKEYHDDWQKTELALRAATEHAEALRRGAINWRERAWKAEAEKKEDLAGRLAAAEESSESYRLSALHEIKERAAAHLRAEAAEERARRLEEALREIGKHECRHAKLGDGIDCTRVGMVFPDGFTACPSCIASAALAPPPEAEKRGENE